MPRFEAHIVHNPYEDSIPRTTFERLIRGCLERRADDISTRFDSGEYVRDALAFIVLDPTASPSVPAEDCILFVGLVGDADFFAPNALAKVTARRDHGISDGELVYNQSHRLADGSFRFGYSVEVDGTQIGASGQTEAQDRYQATLLAADLNYQIQRERASWAKDYAGERWYANEQVAPARFASAIGRALEARVTS